MTSLTETAVSPEQATLDRPTSTVRPPVATKSYRSQARSCRERCRTIALYAAGFSIMTLGSIVMLAVAVVTLFRARRFYCEVIAASMARMGLWMAGIQLVEHDRQRIPPGQVIYVANHWSTLDVFLLLALRLPNARFFLSGHLRSKLPMALIGYLVGVFWTVPQRFPEKRVKIFQRADRILQHTGESVFLSPEGNQGEVEKLGPFNKGAFHLATSLQAPIVPIYINIPRAINPGWGYNFRPGVVDVYYQPPVSTAAWKLEDLDQNRAAMRAQFLEWQQRLQT